MLIQHKASSAQQEELLKKISEDDIDVDPFNEFILKNEDGEENQNVELMTSNILDEPDGRLQMKQEKLVLI